MKLALTVNDELSAARLFEISLTFMHPKTLAELKASAAQRTEQLTEMRRYAEISVHILYGLAALFFLFVLFILVQAVIQKGKDRHTRKLLLAEIGKREELVENGHFVTAHELAEKYLKYFPDDTGIRAFHHRLLDFTNNDPKTAQSAFVEARKLKARLTEHANEPHKLLLSGNEKDNLKALLPYHPELNTAYNKLLQIEERTQVRQNLDVQLTELQSALRGGYLSKAGHVLEQIEAQHPDTPDLEAWRKELDIKKQEAQSAFNQLSQVFQSGHIANGSNELNLFLDKYKDDAQALDLKQGLQQSQGLTKLRLRWTSRSAPLDLFLQNEVIIGRLDEGAAPHIAFDDRRISRNHAVIKINGDRAEITDNGSTGGTYLDGQKITSAVLSDRSILNLAKIKEFKVLETLDTQGKTTGLILSGKNENYGVVFSTLSFTFKNSAMDNSKDEYTVYSDRNLALLAWANGFAALNPDKTIVAGNERITLEAL